MALPCPSRLNSLGERCGSLPLRILLFDEVSIRIMVFPPRNRPEKAEWILLMSGQHNAIPRLISPHLLQREVHVLHGHDLNRGSNVV